MTYDDSIGSFTEDRLFYLGNCNLTDKEAVVGMKSYPEIEYSWFVEQARVCARFTKSEKYPWYQLSLDVIWDNRYNGENRRLFGASQTFDDDSIEWYILMGGWMHQSYTRIKAHAYRVAEGENE